MSWKTDDANDVTHADEGLIPNSLVVELAVNAVAPTVQDLAANEVAQAVEHALPHIAGNTVAHVFAHVVDLEGTAARAVDGSSEQAIVQVRIFHLQLGADA